MIKITFKTLIPNPVKNWIIEKGYEDTIGESERRLKNKLNSVSQFKLSGKVLNVKKDEHGQYIGICYININVDKEDEAKKEFSKIFVDIAKKGQKFKIISYEKNSNT